ncbi:hypothetical protein C8J56DRAFT_892072 [Mycena floridula]|nr:hypothetical protein C8J56DRAFT_892072 [Mycena floridula]
MNKASRTYLSLGEADKKVPLVLLEVQIEMQFPRLGSAGCTVFQAASFSSSQAKQKQLEIYIMRTGSEQTLQCPSTVNSTGKQTGAQCVQAARDEAEEPARCWVASEWSAGLEPGRRVEGGCVRICTELAQSSELSSYQMSSDTMDLKLRLNFPMLRVNSPSTSYDHSGEL